MELSADLGSLFCRAHLLLPQRCFYDSKVTITMHSINPPGRFYVCHVPWPGRLWSQPGQTQNFENHFYQFYDTGVSPVNSHKNLSVKPLQQSLTQTWQGLSREFGQGWSQGQHFDKPWARSCQAPTPADTGAASLKSPESPELGSPAWMQKYQPFNRSARVTAMERKGSDGFQTWLSQQVSWLWVCILK